MRQRLNGSTSVLITIALVFGAALPFLARVPGIPEHGIGWLLDYLRPLTTVGLLLGMHVFPLLFLLGIARASEESRVPFLCAVVPAYIFLFFAHASLDLSSDAQAGIVLVMIPILATIVAALGLGISTLVLALRRRRITQCHTPEHDHTDKVRPPRKPPS